jgi:hypothetical protein
MKTKEKENALTCAIEASARSMSSKNFCDLHREDTQTFRKGILCQIKRKSGKNSPRVYIVFPPVWGKIKRKYIT